MTDISDVVDQALAEPAPEPADDTVELPGGLVLEEGQVGRTARIRELTGADEEAIARALQNKHPLALHRAVMDRCLVDIDGRKADAVMQETLLYGDRDAILLGIRRATYGREYETTVTCPKCAQDSEWAFDLVDDIPARRLADPEMLYRRVELRHGRTAEIRLVNVGDQYEATSDTTRTSTEMNTILLGRCVRSIDDRHVVGAQDMLALGAGDRRILQKHLIDTQPGPQMGEVVVTCPHCGIESTLTLSMTALFL